MAAGFLRSESADILCDHQENGQEATILQDEESVCIPPPKKIGVTGTPVLAQASPNLISSRLMGTPSALRSLESKFGKENVGKGETRG